MEKNEHLSVTASAAGIDATLHRWRCPKRSLLVPLVLGALLLLQGLSMPLQAKELFMNDNQEHYQPYTPGMKLPEGVFPPMQGYTHEDLIGAAAVRAETVLNNGGIDPTLVKESLFAMGKYLKQAFEAQNVEYQISTWYQKPYADPADRGRSVADMAETFGALAVRATTESLRGSPLLDKDWEFIREYISNAGDGVHDLIASLEK
ncbi:hypothetical protein OXL99_00590 [Pseudomonas fulva]|nr:hypothetical protein OXL99_00590 [Pseudomonas fulva]